MKKTFTLVLTFALLAGFGMDAVAATSVRSSKSNSSDRMMDKSSPKLLTGKVAAVDRRAKTFSVIANGKEFVFSAGMLSKLPAVGQNVDVSYAQSPDGQMNAINLNSSKSGVD